MGLLRVDCGQHSSHHPHVIKLCRTERTHMHTAWGRTVGRREVTPTSSSLAEFRLRLCPCSVCRGAPCPQARDCDAGQVCAQQTPPLCGPHASPSSTSDPGSSELSHHASHRPTCLQVPPPPRPPAASRHPPASLGSWLGGGRDPTSFSLGQPRLPHHPPAALRACVSAPCVVGGWEGKGPCPCPRPPGVRGRAVDACVNARGAEGLREPRFPWLLESTHLAQAASTLLSGDRWWGAVWG